MAELKMKESSYCHFIHFVPFLEKLKMWRFVTKSVSVYDIFQSYTMYCLSNKEQMNISCFLQYSTRHNSKISTRQKLKQEQIC